MRTRFDEINDTIIKKVVQAKEIAVLGMSASPHKAANYVPKYLQDHGYRVIPISTNEFNDKILDEKVYRDLMSVPYDYDLLVVFRPSNEIPDIVSNYFSAPYQSPLIWFQSGIYDQESFHRVEEAGFSCVMDKCMMVEHQKMVADGEFKKSGSD